MNTFNIYADVHARSMTQSRNTRSYTLRSVPSSPGRSFLYLKITPTFGIWQFNSIQTTTNWDWNHIIIYSFGQNIFNPILASSFLHNFYKFVQSIKYIKVNYQALKWHSTLIYKEIIFFKSCKTAQLKVFLFVSVWLFAWPGFSSCRKIQREKRKDQLNQDVISFLASNKTTKVSQNQVQYLKEYYCKDLLRDLRNNLPQIFLARNCRQ